MRGAAIFLIVFLISLLPPLYAGSEKILIESPTVNQGMEARATIILDSAPKGLAGYDIIVSLRSGEVADILRVEFPQWAKLSNSSIRGDSIKLKALDLEDKVKPGATNIVLATVIFGNTRQGESLIELTVIKMDDDDGNPITPVIEPGKLTVIGPPPTQTTTTTTTQTVTEATITQETETMPTITVTPTTETTQAIVTTYTSSPYVTSLYYTYTSTVIVETPSTIYLVLAVVMLISLIAVVGALATLYLRRRRKPRVLRVE